MIELDEESRNQGATNIACYLTQMAQKHPDKRAVVFPFCRDHCWRIAYTHLTFQQLDRESDSLAFGLEEMGIQRGVRTVLMVKPGIEFFALTFALFKVGAVPVVVDPGMGIARLLRCLGETAPEAFIGIPLAHLIRIFYPKYFRSVDRVVTVGRKWFWRGETYRSLSDRPWQPFVPVTLQADDTAAILFTTGSTGPAKGAVYSHRNFAAQVESLRESFKFAEDEIDLPTFPLFALFDPALGLTAVIPEMDPTRPAKVNPNRILEAIENQGVTNIFASPALLNRVGRHCEAHQIQLPSLRRVISAGAPVSTENISRFAALLKGAAEIHTPYGATEAMPVAVIGSHEILLETAPLTEKGYGICVGLPAAGIELNIIRIMDLPIQAWTDELELPDGEIGEIVVRGDVVTRSYFQNPNADANAKIADEEGFWHRMGDLGWKDKSGRIWFCGRKNHRVETQEGPLYTIPCEAVFNRHASVFRSALVGVGPLGDQTPVICIELMHKASRRELAAIKEELLQAARAHVLTRQIETLLFHDAFPVDIRHNSKIFREELAQWAARKLKVQP